MKKILAFSGSNSANSINTKLVKAVAGKVKNNSVTHLDLRDFPLPIYSIDIEKGEEGIPKNAKKLKEIFDQHDGFIISVPEHNRSVPAFFKNTIDWISRIHMSFFEHKPILLLTTSPGPGGGKSSAVHATDILSNYLAGKIVGKFNLPRFHQNTEGDETGIRITDQEMNDEVTALVSDFESYLKTSQIRVN